LIILIITQRGQCGNWSAQRRLSMGLRKATAMFSALGV